MKKRKMKKVIKIPTSTKGIFSSKYFKIFIVVLLVLMIIMSAILIRVYFDINKKETENKSSAKNIISQMDKNIDSYTVFEDENGLLGVYGKDEKQIIEPYWNDIYILSSNRFIVSRNYGTKKKMGIINDESNIIVPFIFETFKSISNEFIGGFTGNENDLFLFDKNGNIIAEKKWTNYKYSDKTIFLYDGKNEYRGRFVDDSFQFVYVNIVCNPKNIPFNVVIDNQRKIENIGTDNIRRAGEITEGYLEYLISGNDSMDISDLTSEQYYSSLSSNDFFKDCKIKRISDFTMDVSKDISKDDPSVSYNAKVVVNYDYSQEDVELKNISSEITLNMVCDENNRLILKSISKTEI